MIFFIYLSYSLLLGDADGRPPRAVTVDPAVVKGNGVTGWSPTPCPNPPGIGSNQGLWTRRTRADTADGGPYARSWNAIGDSFYE